MYNTAKCIFIIQFYDSLMIDFLTVDPQLDCLSSNFFCTCLLTCSHHTFWKFLATCISLYNTIAIFPWSDNSVSMSINLILLKNAKLACDQVFLFRNSSYCSRLCQACTTIMLQHPFRHGILSFCFTQRRCIIHNTSCNILNIDLLHWMWGSMTTVSSLYLALSFRTCGETELVGEEAGEVVCNAALDLLEFFAVEALCWGDGCVAAAWVALDGLVAGGALAALLMADPCLLLEDASLLIFSTTSVNECNLLAVEVAATLDVDSSSPTDFFSLLH